GLPCGGAAAAAAAAQGERPEAHHGTGKSGRHVGRVHVVDQPLSPYVRYELAVYAENVSAGEDVRIADSLCTPNWKLSCRTSPSSIRRPRMPLSSCSTVTPEAASSVTGLPATGRPWSAAGAVQLGAHPL